MAARRPPGWGRRRIGKSYLISPWARDKSTLRAIWEEVAADSKLRVLLTGSAVRAMEALQAERAPLFGRATLRLHLRPFTPGESALMLPGLSPAERVREYIVWGIGSDIAEIIEDGFADFMGARWEEAFRRHLVTVALEDPRLRPVAGIGEFWRPGTRGDEDQCELDGVVLTGRARAVSLVGEAKWAVPEPARLPRPAVGWGAAAYDTGARPHNLGYAEPFHER